MCVGGGGGVWAALIQSVRRHQQIKNARLPGRRAPSTLLVSSLQTFPAEFQLTSLHNYTRQFLTVNLCMCIEHTYVKEMHSVLATHTHTHTHTQPVCCISLGDPDLHPGHRASCLESQIYWEQHMYPSDSRQSLSTITSCSRALLSSKTSVRRCWRQFRLLFPLTHLQANAIEDSWPQLPLTRPGHSRWSLSSGNLDSVWRANALEGALPSPSLLRQRCSHSPGSPSRVTVEGVPSLKEAEGGNLARGRRNGWVQYVLQHQTTR